MEVLYLGFRGLTKTTITRDTRTEYKGGKEMERTARPCGEKKPILNEIRESRPVPIQKLRPLKKGQVEWIESDEEGREVRTLQRYVG